MGTEDFYRFKKDANHVIKNWLYSTEPMKSVFGFHWHCTLQKIVEWILIFCWKTWNNM